MVLVGDMNIANAEVINNTKGYYYPNSGMSFDLNITEGDYIDWSFKTYDHTFCVDVVIIDELENEQILSEGETEDSHGVVFGSSGLYELEFMNYDIYSGYMEVFVGLNEEEENEFVAITSVNCDDDRSLIDISWEVKGSVFFIKLDLYYGYEFVTEIYDEIQCIHSSTNWGFYDNEDVFSGDKFQIKISDVDDPDVYSFSNYFTIEIDDPTDPVDPNGIPSFNPLIIIGIIGSISVISAIVIRKKINKKSKF